MPTQDGAQGLSGAAADFVASLGKKIADARTSLVALEGDLSARPARDDLRRKLHAMGTSARMLRFDAMARALAEAEAVVDANASGLSRKVLVVVDKILDDLPALAWSQKPAPARDDEPDAALEEPEVAPAEDAANRSAPPLTALVVGPESVAEMLAEESDHAGRYVECERTADAQAALGLARAIAPDVLILDAQMASAEDLIEALSDDPLTEPVPVVVVGSMTGEQAARFTALGVARVLTAPYSGEALRSVCEEVVDQREGRTVRMTLGEPTIEQLGERLAAEVHRALVDSVDPLSRGKRVSLGEGTEVMAAVWGAIARVREVVTARTGGEVRFAGRGPEGTALLAPWLNPDLAGAERARPRGRGAAADVVLEGRRVIVADDDPGVTWFLADLLRTSGCVVHEALDGATALDLCMRMSPDLVLSDILMPKMDGFALSRALKRDVALRDTPVILLSWKEDLLQRVRELGASAAAYLRKETDARAVLARVREALWPRARIEARLKGSGEVRGRLDGLTVRTLLEFVCALRPNARVSVRDASSLYEMEIRDGSPKRVTRTLGDGSFVRGERALAAMLGVGAGRFVVAPSSGSGLHGGELTGSLAELLEVPLATARGAMALVPTILARRASVKVDAEVLPGYLLTTPEPARSLVERLANGAIVQDLLISGDAPPSLLEDVLSDLAARGAIVAVTDESGDDALPGSIQRALDVLRGAPARKHEPLSKLRSSQMPPRMLKAPASVPSLQSLAEEVAPAPQEPTKEGVPSSLADAVMKEISDRSPVPGVSHSSLPPPIIEPSELKPRSNPPERIVDPPPARRGPAEVTDVETLYEAQIVTPSVPISTEESLLEEDDEEDDEQEDAARPDSQEPARTPLAAESAKRPEPGSSTWKWAVGLVAVTALVGVAVRSSLVSSPPEPPPPVLANASVPEATYSDLPPGATVGKNEGWLEVTAPPNATVLVDGVERGRGPTHVAAALGPHDVKVDGQLRSITVREGKSAHADFTAP